MNNAREKSRRLWPAVCILLSLAAHAPLAGAQSPGAMTEQQSGTVEYVDARAGAVVIDDREYRLAPAAVTALRPGMRVTFRSVWQGRNPVITEIAPAPSQR
jgi:hypothetical protein